MSHSEHTKANQCLAPTSCEWRLDQMVLPTQTQVHQNRAKASAPGPLFFLQILHCSISARVASPAKAARLLHRSPGFRNPAAIPLSLHLRARTAMFSLPQSPFEKLPHDGIPAPVQRLGALRV